MPTNRYTVKLSEIEKDSIKQVGGKAVNLGFLIRKGFNVPNGFVVTTDAYNRFITENNLGSYILDEHANDSEQVSRKIREAITSGEIPEDIRDEIIKNYNGLTRKEVAIRSSATSEDLKDTSFAGQMDTFLNVITPEAVLQYIKRCYASLWTNRAISYREKNSIDHQGVTIAVVVQEIIEPNAAGVMFTSDPVSSEGSIVVESNYGYGESVVSGKATPDRFKISRGAMEITVREIGTKELEAVKSPEGGIVFVEPSLERREQPSLTDKELLGLTRLGVDVETAYGAPQDIEWVVADDALYLLQSRPITTDKDERDATSWTRGYSDDYWNDNVSPFFFELMGDHITEIVNVELNELMGYTKPGEMNALLKLHKAHTYFNLDVLKHKVIYEIPTFIRNNDVLNYFPEGDGPYGKETIKNLPFHFAKRVNAEYRIRIRDPNGATERTADAYDKWTSDVLDPFWRGFEERLNKFNNEPLVSYLGLMNELNTVIVDHFRLVRYGIPVHNIGMNLMSQYLLKRFLGEEKASLTYPILVSGLKHSTSKTNDALFNLAGHIRANPDLRNLVLETESELVLDELDAQSDSEFLAIFNRFMDDYGCRGFTREPFYPRWSEAPRYVFDILKSLVMDEGSDLTLIEERNKAERQRVETEIREAIKHQSLGWAKNKLLNAVVDVARRYIVFREEQRYNLDKWIFMNRLLYMQIGGRLTEQGVLSEPSDIFFLHRDEVKQAINGTQTITQYIIQQRRNEFHRYENITPPKFLEGAREYNDPLPPTAQTYYGLPASQGVLTSTVRVLSSITEITDVRAGEILVVPRTDPGWTPVFSKIGGLITETGGVLSHGAVVSREYGVPAVTNISNACRIFQTGQVVTINGAMGSVHLDE